MQNKKITTLKNNKDFKKIYNRGQSVVSKNVVTYVLKNNLNYNRIGITASKKIGNAVKRNRARRLIKQSYALISNELSMGYDIVFVARALSTNSRLKYVKKDVCFTLKAKKMFKDN